MSELANYSIETDHTVLLAFRDGRRLRVPVGQLPHHLAPPDLEKVRAAIKLRHEFIRRHMPKAAIILAAGGLIALLAVGGRAVATLMNHPQAVPPAPTQTEIVRSQAAPNQESLPAPQPSVVSEPKVATSRSVVHRSLHRIQPVVKHLPAVVPISVPEPSVSPIASPTPEPQGGGDQQLTQNPGTQSPGPTPSPTPQIPNQGQVLGCSSADPAACSDPTDSSTTIP